MSGGVPESQPGNNPSPSSPMKIRKKMVGVAGHRDWDIYVRFGW